MSRREYVTGIQRKYTHPKTGTHGEVLAVSLVFALVMVTGTKRKAVIIYVLQAHAPLYLLHFFLKTVVGITNTLENTCIGGNCKILDNDFHPIEVEARNQLLRDSKGGDSDLVPSKEIRIGKNCFLGCNSIVLKGTVLGDGCVVGAGAVVSGKFEENCVIAGNPARVIKRLDNK